MMIKSNDSKGFTLVELSIVLVIIGLLIGGILAAQSMISTAKIQAFVRQIGQFDAAVASFQSRYNGLPGDSSVFGCASAGVFVCDDGLIELSNGQTSNIWELEAADFWPNLSDSGLKAENVSGGTYTSGSMSVESGAPKAKIGNNQTGIYVVGDSTPTVLADSSTAANMYIVADCSAGSVMAINCSQGLSGIDSIAVDKKLDDGVGTTGNITASDSSPVDSWDDLTDGTEIAYPTTCLLYTSPSPRDH
jgi:prepilin-type N-terminal cleavage/methylation domain-containing protein